MNQVFHADCLNILKTLPNNSVDAVITDPPYGYLKHKLDCLFDAQLLFSECFRVLKDTGFLLFFGSGFEFAKWNVICSELGFIFKEELIWYKKRTSSPYSIVGRIHESISLLAKKNSKLNKVFVDKIEFDEAMNPKIINQDYKRILSDIHKIKSYDDFILWSNELTEHKNKHSITTGNIQNNYSKSYTTFKGHQRGAGLRSIIPMQTEHYNFQHPTQKPVKLFKQLVELTTKEGDLILDPFAGSGTTAIASLELNRKYICVEKDKEYFEVIENRIAKWHEENKQKELFTCN